MLKASQITGMFPFDTKSNKSYGKELVGCRITIRGEFGRPFDGSITDYRESEIPNPPNNPPTSAVAHPSPDPKSNSNHPQPFVREHLVVFDNGESYWSDLAVIKANGNLASIHSTYIRCIEKLRRIDYEKVAFWGIVGLGLSASLIVDRKSTRLNSSHLA